jgi:membrane fusion protein (multidrug efflux system)
MTPTSRWSGAGILALALATSACAGNGSAASKNTTPAVGRPPVAVSVSAAVTADLVEAVDVVGSLAPKFSADVKSEVSGIITAVYVTEWVPIRKGAPLARLDTTETEAGIQALKAGEAQARIGEARAKREYERATQLKEYGLITPQNFDDAKTALDAAAAVTEAASAQVRTAEARLKKSFISAPMDGVVASRGINVGDRVENMGSGSPAFRIVDNRLFDLTVSVPSPSLALVHVGQVLEFTTDGVPGRTFTGKVMFINPSVDEISRSAKVIAEVQNGDNALKGGLFVKGRIIVASRPKVLQVPKEALLNWNVTKGTADVYIVRAGRAEKHQVQIGKANGVSVEVVSGVSDGDQVVTRGAFALRPGDRVTVAAAQGA